MADSINKDINELNKRIDKLLKFEEKDYSYRSKKQEKYQTKNPDKQTEQEKTQQKEIRKSGGFINDLLGFITKIGTLIASYKIAEWVANPKNVKKLSNILQGFYNIGKFISNFVDGVLWWTKGTISNIFTVGKAFGDFFNSAVGFVQMITNPFYSAKKILGEAPANIKKSFDSLLEGITTNLGGAADKATTDANNTIKEGIENLKNPENTSTIEANPEPTTSTPSIPDITTPKKVNFDNPTVPGTPVKNQPESTKPEPDLPKLAKGGIVAKSNASPTNNIKPLSSLLTGTTNNEKFNNEIKNITPKFEELMKLPFSIIGSGIVGILKSAMKDNPDANNNISPLINSIGKMFDVSVGDTNNALKVGKESKINTNDNDNLNEIIGTKNPNVVALGEGNNKFESSNDTTIRGLLADILNAFISKIPPKTVLPTKSIGGMVNGNGSGWITGSHDGYGVSLDGGKNTNFIGHGTEYVSKHKSNNSSFVIPYDTPATKTNQNLTGNRIKEAIIKGYDVPKMAVGGMLPQTYVTSSTYNPGGGGMEGAELDARGKKLTRGDSAIAIPGQNKIKDQIPYNSVVNLSYKGKSTNAKVVDGGPYFPGRQMDMTTAAAKSLGFTGVDKVGVKLVQLPNGEKNDKKYYFGEATYKPAITKNGSITNAEANKAIKSVVAGDKFLSLTGDSINAASTNNNAASSTVTPTAPLSNAAATTPAMNDYGKIGSAFTTLTQMLGVGGSKKTNNNPKVISIDNPDSSGTGISAKKKAEPEKNNAQMPRNTSSDYKPVPKVPPLPTPNPSYKKSTKMSSPPTLSTNPINSNTYIGGESVAVANKTIYSATSFNFSSDAHRFTAVASMNGNITDSIFV